MEGGETMKAGRISKEEKGGRSVQRPFRSQAGETFGSDDE